MLRNIPQKLGLSSKPATVKFGDSFKSTYVGPLLKEGEISQGKITCDMYTYTGEIYYDGKKYLRHGVGTTKSKSGRFTDPDTLQIPIHYRHYLDGDICIGKYNLDKMEGQCKIIKGDVVVVEGIFKNNYLVEGYYKNDEFTVEGEFNAEDHSFIGKITTNFSFSKGKFYRKFPGLIEITPENCVTKSDDLLMMTDILNGGEKKI